MLLSGGRDGAGDVRQTGDGRRRRPVHLRGESAPAGGRGGRELTRPPFAAPQLFPIALVFFYALYRLFTHQKVYSSPESLLLDAEMMMERHKESLREADVENQKRMAGLLAKVEREQERQLEMSAELSRERAERMRGAEGYIETAIRIR